MANTVYVGSARSDERGKAYGGKPGDQKSGKEVSTQAWYKHSKGWRVFRPKDRGKGEMMAYAMQAACDNDLIGYNQHKRLTLYELAAKVRFDPARVTAKCDTDCSALVRVCMAYAGITSDNFTTGNQAKRMLATGAFEELTGSKYTDCPHYLRAGDVLVTKTKGHTVIVLNDGRYAVPEESKPVTYQKTVTVTGNTVNLRTGPGTQYKSVGTVHKGDVLEGVTGWSPVLIDGDVLWISNKYTEEKE